MKPEKLTDEVLKASLREVDRRGRETRLKEPLALGRQLRAHIAALEAERDAALRQGQADHRALHDALGWAHVWHGKELPQPSRAAAMLIADRDVYKRDASRLLAKMKDLREKCGAREDEALESLVARLYQDARALAAVRERAADEKRMVSVQPSHVAGLVIRAIDRILGVNESGGAQSPEETAVYSIPALPADAQADALVSKRCAGQEPAAVSAGAMADPLHPNGGCTCGGEGTCARCARLRCAGCGKESVDLCSPCETAAKQDQDVTALRSPSVMSEIDEPTAGAPLTLVVPTATELFVELGRTTQEHIDDDEARCIAKGALSELERRVGAMARGMTLIAAYASEQPADSYLVGLVSAALTDAPLVYTLEEVRESMRALKLPEKYVEAVVKDLAALRSTGDGR